MEKKNLVVDKSIEVTLIIIDSCDLMDTEKKYIISRQLLKSGTTIGANFHEAQNSESNRDFIHKFKMRNR